MKNKIRVFYIIMALNISIFIILNLLSLGVLDIKSYENKFNKYNIGHRAYISKYDSTIIINQTMDYIITGEEFNLISNYYNDYELEHLIDIYEIFYCIKKLKILLFITIFVQLIILFNNKTLLDKINILKQYLNINYFVILYLVLIANINFKKYFIYFHKILFKNNYWILDPDVDLLIQLMPQQLFLDVLIKLIVIYILIILMIQLFIFLLDKKMKLGYNLIK